MNRHYLNALLATLAIGLTACTQAPLQEGSGLTQSAYVQQLRQQPIAQPSVSAEFELVTADGMHSSWSSVNTRLDSAKHISVTATGTVHVFTRTEESLSYVSVGLTRDVAEGASLTADDGNSIQVPVRVRTLINCRIAKGESCVLKDAKDQTLATVRWKA